MLELKDVSVSYGRIAAVQALSLEVKEGEFVGLVGHNGAGKSTTLMTITGALSPVSGEIVFDGQSIVGMAPDEIRTNPAVITAYLGVKGAKLAQEHQGA